MKKIGILLVAAALLIGCNDNKGDEGGETPNRLVLSTETLNFLVDGTSDGGNAVTVTSDSDWRLAGYESWCTPSATSGKNGDQVTFTVAENPSNDARDGVYTFICGNKAVKLTVAQLQNSVFEPLGSETYTMSSLRQTITFIVRSSFSLEPEIDAPWIVNADVEPTRGVETHFLRFLVEENPEYSGREGKIYVAGPDGTRYELTVAQSQKHAIIASKKNYDVDAAGGTVTVSLQSNVDYTVTLSGYAWITEDTDATRGLNPSQKRFRVAGTSDTRQGQIIFRYSSPDGSPAVADTVLIAQRAGQTEQVTVPDANFRYYLRKNDYVLSKPGEPVCEMTAKGKALTSMSCGSQKIASLKGVEAFTALTSLTCSSNSLSELDVSANTALTSLSCSYNLITKLDLTKQAALRTLTVSYNPLEEVVLSPTATVTSLSLTSLRDQSSTVYSSKIKVVAPKVTSIVCYNNQLTELDVAGCSAVTSLSCYGNQLTKLDISGCTALKTLNCYNNKLGAINVSANTALTTLNCYGNQLAALNVETNTALTTVNCYSNNLKTLDVSANLKLATLNCTSNPDMTTLYMAQDQTIRTLAKDDQTEIIRK